MNRILPTFLALLTGHDRYFPEIEWSSKSWTHNVFRVYEILFGRRYGIRAEMSTVCFIEDGKKTVYRACHSWESVFALVETYIRDFIHSYKPKPFRIFIPQFSTPVGVHFASPYLFAIAFDSVTPTIQETSAASSISYSHTCTGSDLIIVGYTLWAPAIPTLTAYSYNSVNGTIVDQQAFGTLNESDGIAIKSGPSTGSHTVVHTLSATATIVIRAGSISYSGCAQTEAVDSHAKTTGSFSASTNVASTTTVVASNCWLVMGTSNGTGSPVAGSGTTLRLNNGGLGFGILDSNGTVGTGAQSLNWQVNVGAGDYSMCIFSFAPMVAAGPANLKSLDANVKANIKSYNSNLIANIKSIDSNV